jgi:hypothetical protein
LIITLVVAVVVAADAPPHHFNDGIMDPSLMVMMRPSYATPLFDSQVRVLDHAAGVLACSGLTPYISSV